MSSNYLIHIVTYFELNVVLVYTYSCPILYQHAPGLEIHFFVGSKLLLPSSKLGSKTNFVVAKC